VAVEIDGEPVHFSTGSPPRFAPLLMQPIALAGYLLFDLAEPTRRLSRVGSAGHVPGEERENDDVVSSPMGAVRT